MAFIVKTVRNPKPHAVSYIVGVEVAFVRTWLDESPVLASECTNASVLAFCRKHPNYSVVRELGATLGQTAPPKPPPVVSGDLQDLRFSGGQGDQLAARLDDPVEINQALAKQWGWDDQSLNSLPPSAKAWRSAGHTSDPLVVRSDVTGLTLPEMAMSKPPRAWSPDDGTWPWESADFMPPSPSWRPPNLSPKVRAPETPLDGPVVLQPEASAELVDADPLDDQPDPLALDAIEAWEVLIVYAGDRAKAEAALEHAETVCAEAGGWMNKSKLSYRMTKAEYPRLKKASYEALTLLAGEAG